MSQHVYGIPVEYAENARDKYVATSPGMPPTTVAVLKAVSSRLYLENETRSSGSSGIIEVGQLWAIAVIEVCIDTQPGFAAGML